MKKKSLKQHKFDSIMRLVLLLALMVFTFLLEVIHSGLGKDVALVIIGALTGKKLAFMQ